jgi:hypothetical protein
LLEAPVDDELTEDVRSANSFNFVVEFSARNEALNVCEMLVVSCKAAEESFDANNWSSFVDTKLATNSV